MRGKQNGVFAMKHKEAVQRTAPSPAFMRNQRSCLWSFPEESFKPFLSRQRPDLYLGWSPISVNLFKSPPIP